MPKKMDFGAEAPVVSAEPSAPPSRHKSLNLPTTPAPPVLEEPERAPKSLHIENGTLTHQRAERPRTLTDNLCDRSKAQSPDIDVGRIRGRIDMLLTATNETLIQWGEVNLTPLQKASDIQARIAAELQRIDAVGRLNEAKDAAMGVSKGFFDRFAQKKPDTYEFKLQESKRDLLKLMSESDRQMKGFLPEVRDLHLDGLALSVVIGEYQDAVLMNIGNSRLKTLLLAHQTGTMLMTVLENTVQQCAQYIEQIDSMLSVTIPQWKLALQNKP